MRSGAQKATELQIAKWQESNSFLGVDDLGTLDIDKLRQLGRSFRSRKE